MTMRSIALTLLLAIGACTVCDAQWTSSAGVPGTSGSTAVMPAQGATPGTTQTPPATGQTPANGQNPSSGDSMSAIAQTLLDGGLVAVLSDVDMARALGLDFEQWMAAQFIINGYEHLAAMLMWFDPEGQNAETLESLEMVRFFVDFELYLLLTPEQQQTVNQLFQQAMGTGNTGTGGTESGGSNGTSGSATTGSTTGSTAATKRP